MRIITSNSNDSLLKLADVRFNPEELARMRSEGTYMVNDPDVAEPNTMQDLRSSKTKIQTIMNKVPITLPKIVFPTLDQMVELDGRQYYIIHITKPNPKKNVEGTISLLDVETGDPIKKPFMAVAGRLQEIKKQQVSKSVTELNALVKKWNSTIDKIEAGTSVINPSTWPLQLMWTENVVKERIAELDGQLQGIRANLDEHSNFSPSYSDTLNRMKADVLAGRIPQADIYDTIMFIQHSDPDSVESILEEAPISDEIKSQIRRLITLRNEAKEAARIAREKDKAEKEQMSNTPATEEEIEGMLSPGETDLSPTTELGEDSYATRIAPDSYFAPKARMSQDRRMIMEITEKKDQLLKVQAALDGLAEFIGKLSKGERAKSILMSDKGVETKEKIANFIFAANSFIRNYKVSVFIPREDSNAYQLNPKLLGTEGGLGNGAVAIALNHMTNVIKAGLKSYANPNATEEARAEMPANVNDYLMEPQDVPV